MGAKKHILARLIASLLFIAVVAGTWDAWWHGAVGRDSFWEAPHLLLYSAVIIAIILGIYGWHITRETKWARLAIILLIVPLSAPFDELWHRAFGVEDLTSPLVIWSPPHLALIFSVIISLILVLPLLRQDKAAKVFFGSLVFAAIISLSLFVMAPLQPSGPFSLLGFWGAAFMTLVFVGILLIAKGWIRGFASATVVTAFFLLITAIGFSEQIAPGVVIVPHDHPPPFLTIFSYLVPAVLIDLWKAKLWFRGAMAGLLSGGILYGFAWFFFEPQFKYGFADGLTATVASLIGGLIAGIAVMNMRKKLSEVV